MALTPGTAPEIPSAAPRNPAREALGAFVGTIALGLVLSDLAVRGLAVARGGAAAFGSRDAFWRVAVTMPGALVAMAAVILAEGVVLVLGVRRSGLPARERLRLGPSTAPPEVLAAMIGCMILLSHGLDAAVHLAGLGEYGALGLLRDLFEGASAADLAAAGVLVGVGVGMIEEMLFRGFIQTGLAARLGAARGVAAASLLFGAAHMDAVQGPMAVLLGLYLGAVTEWTGSIRPAIACHVANNLFGTIAPAVLPFTPSPTSHAISIAVAAAGLAIGIPWIHRRRSVRGSIKPASADRP